MPSPLPAVGTATTSPAPEIQIPPVRIHSVEYPGYVHPTSVPEAVRTLGGHQVLEKAFRKSTKPDAFLELRYRPDNPFAHPIAGEVVQTNSILLKVVKRRRKRMEGTLTDEQDAGSIGEYTVEPVGLIPGTARFRGLADYQYNPDPEDPVSKLRMAMEDLDVDAIRKFIIPEEKEDYTAPRDPNAMSIDPEMSGGPPNATVEMKSTMRTFPPPLFSRISIPQQYNFKANPNSRVVTVVDEATGVEKQRYVNKDRWKGYGPVTAMYSDSGVPTEPTDVVAQMRNSVNSNIQKALLEKFSQRPIWTRTAILNQFTPAEAREIHNSKIHLPLVAYVFQDGPWRDTFVRFGYDPRKDINARFYQRIYFRNANHSIVRPSVTERRQDVRNSTEGGEDKKFSHIFDGVRLNTETAAFQLCDIHDGMLKQMIEGENDEDLREECDATDGWYTSQAIERIKVVLRHKFFQLLQGHIATEEECEALLNEPLSKATMKSRAPKLRMGKHNMAKGALPPEELAAMRLHAQLQKGMQKRS
ncbi:RNA polymerase III transcription factor IIIC subunit-domain-containing protein [Thelephora terrestris]|uniref:RNA polymerase III transcription factor IIIC subunit-domain-containing protein n=1 Tax=Thelephora terrestris TaxID=56493 RepID=A0A9P6H6H9_9AGAM|nr:RNA polymerase III transcription factor IIIC subunit-domain-containing protein [Thelephora terrestris]